MALDDIIEQKINDVVPQMIEDAISVHTHTGTDSPQLTAESFAQAPQSPITTPSGGTVIDIEGRAAINSILSTLQALGLINQ